MRSPDSIIFRDRVSAAFAQRVVAIADELGINPDWLMSIFAFETAGTFSASIQNPHSGATGLIQFMPDTARALDTSTGELAHITPVEQLDFVQAYFAQYDFRIHTLEDAYMAVLWPAAIGEPLDHVIFSEDDGLAYRWNSGLDANDDGSVTKAEAAAHVVSIYEEAVNDRIDGAHMDPAPVRPLPHAASTSTAGTINANFSTSTTERIPTGDAQSAPKKKPLHKSKTAWGVAATILGVAGMAIGLGPEWAGFIADGLQWADLVPAVAAVGAAATAYDNLTR